MSYIASASKKLSELGLVALCQVQLGADDWRIIFASAGTGWFTRFAASDYAHDELPDPMDRFTKASLEALFSAQPQLSLVYPFDKEPYPPFQRWVQQAQQQAQQQATQAPFGMMIHNEFGQWHAYRAALVSPLPWPQSALWQAPAGDEKQSLNCTNCSADTSAKPCLKPCPIDAISAVGYDFQACRDYLRTTPTALCHQQGCLARNACPAGSKYRYSSDQIRFHMKAFVG